MEPTLLQGFEALLNFAGTVCAASFALLVYSQVTWAIRDAKTEQQFQQSKKEKGL